MDYALLSALIATHPNPSVTSDADMLAWVLEEVVVVDSDFLPSSAIFATILNHKAEWDALSANNRDLVRDILVIYANEGVPTAPGTPARTQLIAILGNATKTELAGLIPKNISRAVNAGIPEPIKLGDIEFARTF